MLTRLRLEGFKSFLDAELHLGPLTVLVGTNASGKSNIRDALRFLHGVGRGYAIAEILGEKYGEGGEQVWRGIRGGSLEAAYRHGPGFALEVQVRLNAGLPDAVYRIEVRTGCAGKPPVVTSERLYLMGEEHPLFEAAAEAENEGSLQVRVWHAPEIPRHVPVSSLRPVLAQFLESAFQRLLRKPGRARESHVLRAPQMDADAEVVRSVAEILRSTRFLDLSLDAMRTPSFPGQLTLGDHGEHLSSILQASCEDPQRKEALVHWIQALTPMDATDFEFPPDQIGRVLVTLVEADGQRTSAYSASDGTLRFLGLLAALLGPGPARFFFFEELESGIHPTRIHLALDLIERQAHEGLCQVVATTHSPALLGLLSDPALEDASLAYRLDGVQETRIQRIAEIPDARRVIREYDLGTLHGEGWLENAMSFIQDEAA